MHADNWNMFYEEKVLDGLLHWRADERDDWIPFTAQQLTQKLVVLRVLFQKMILTQQ